MSALVIQRWFLAFFYLLAVLFGISGALGSFAPLPALLLPLIWQIVLCEWAIGDSIARGRPIPSSARSWFFLTAGFAAPAYVIWTRGWRGCGWLALQVVLWYAVYVLAWIAAAIAINVLR